MGAKWIAGAILVAATAIIATMLYLRSQDQKCAQWQSKVRDFAESINMPTGGFVVESFENRRPSGCPNP